MKPTYVQAAPIPGRIAAWHIKDGDTGKTLCGYAIEVVNSQGETPQIGCCPRCLSIQVFRSRQAREAQKVGAR